MTTAPRLAVAEPAPRAEASAALEAAGVTVRPLDTLEGVRAAEALFVEVWRSDAEESPFPAEVMRAIEHAGGYVVGAFDGTAMVAASAGFLGLDAEDHPTLHSHITGVRQGLQGRGVGRALKLHQRAWAVDRGIRTITWTFDPLVRRNAWFNLTRLGAVGAEYLVDFYGPMTDGINAGTPSDRLLCRWDLLGSPAPVPTGGLLVLDAVEDRPVPLSAGGAGPLLVRLPEDVEALRQRDPGTAAAWRLAVRDVLVPALDQGLRARGVTADGALVLS